MYRTITPIAVLGAALVLAVPAAFGKGQPVEPQWMQALELRSEALNRQHGLGEYNPALRALKLRSEALNHRYGLGRHAYPASTIAVTEAIESVRDRRSPEWLDVFMRGLEAINREAAYPYSTMAVNGAIESVRGGDQTTSLSNGAPPDVFERAVAARGTGGSTLDRFIANDNRHHVKPTSQPRVVSATGSGDEIEWPQVGIGFGVGIALAFGLLLAMRMTRQPPLAH